MSLACHRESGAFPEYLLYTCHASLFSPFCRQGEQTKRAAGPVRGPGLRAEAQRSCVHPDRLHFLSPRPCEPLCLRIPCSWSGSVKEGSLEEEGANSKDCFYLLPSPDQAFATAVSNQRGCPQLAASSPIVMYLLHKMLALTGWGVPSVLTGSGCSGNVDSDQEQTPR